MINRLLTWLHGRQLRKLMQVLAVPRHVAALQLLLLLPLLRRQLLPLPF
jgi:hypothetical protein